MTKTLRLNDLQLVLLAGAAGRENGSLIPLPENCRQDSARIDKAITSLRRRGLVEEMAVADRDLVWRTDGESMIGLFITPAGRDAIGAGGEESAGDEDAPRTERRPASKVSQVLALLQRDEGATLDELVTITGWLPHTTRAALTGLKKKGHVVAKGKRDDVTCYNIAGGGVRVANLDEQLREIADMPRPELQRRWAKLTGRPVPRLSAAMLRLALGYEVQVKAKGRLARANHQRLDASSPVSTRAVPLTPGMRLVREWHGTIHVVTVDENGVLIWNDQRWKSLSEIARTITGTRWSGPAFFGLKQRKAA